MSEKQTMLYVNDDAVLAYIPKTKERGIPVIYTQSAEILVPGVAFTELREVLPILQNRAVICFAPDSLSLYDRPIIYCGTRNTLSFRSYSMHDIMQEGITQICDVLMESSRSFPEVVVLISLTVLDPAFNPVSTNPGGMSTRELLYFIKRLKHLKNIIFWTITDLTPENYLVAGVLAAEML